MFYLDGYPGVPRVRISWYSIWMGIILMLYVFRYSMFCLDGYYDVPPWWESSWSMWICILMFYLDGVPLTFYLDWYPNVLPVWLIWCSTCMGHLMFYLDRYLDVIHWCSSKIGILMFYQIDILMFNLDAYPDVLPGWVSGACWRHAALGWNMARSGDSARWLGRLRPEGRSRLTRLARSD